MEHIFILLKLYRATMNFICIRDSESELFVLSLQPTFSHYTDKTLTSDITSYQEAFPYNYACHTLRPYISEVRQEKVFFGNPNNAIWDVSFSISLTTPLTRKQYLIFSFSFFTSSSFILEYIFFTLSISGIIKGDEIMVINGAIVSDLDMMYLESVLQEEQALCMMMR